MKNENPYEYHEFPAVGFILDEFYYHPDDRLVKINKCIFLSRRQLKIIYGKIKGSELDLIPFKYKPKYDTKLIKILIK